MIYWQELQKEMKTIYERLVYFCRPYQMTVGSTPGLYVNFSFIPASIFMHLLFQYDTDIVDRLD